MGDLLVGQTFQLTQHQRLAEFGRQPAEPLVYGLARDRARQVGLRRRELRLERVGLLVELDHCASRAPAAELREARVAHDAQDPRPSIRPAEATEMPDRPQERLLHGFLRLVAVAKQIAREVVRGIEVRQHTFIESLPLSGREMGLRARRLPALLVGQR